MRRSSLIAFVLPLTLAGCLSFSSSDPNPPPRQTVVVPQPTAVPAPPADTAPPPGTTCAAPC
ncbi:hypothetical protein [Paraburkholderia acidipaludis]|uniref:hypothetical protein n=1 Tax=Paraburkholderia acidipaludis TaxID=660537 RepID=UPI0005BA1718|nr:hypothetical protein [Paraburkholderia acidipaludis]